MNDLKKLAKAVNWVVECENASILNKSVDTEEKLGAFAIAFDVGERYGSEQGRRRAFEVVRDAMNEAGRVHGQCDDDRARGFWAAFEAVSTALGEMDMPNTEYAAPSVPEDGGAS